MRLETKKFKAFRLKPELVRALDLYSKEKGRTQTDVVEKALGKYLQDRKDRVLGLRDILEDND